MVFEILTIEGRRWLPFATERRRLNSTKAIYRFSLKHRRGRKSIRVCHYLYGSYQTILDDEINHACTHLQSLRPHLLRPWGFGKPLTETLPHWPFMKKMFSRPCSINPSMIVEWPMVRR
jgi:hypothetical protein